MGEYIIDGVIISPLDIISVPGGDVLHALKSNDPGYVGFGEAYFSTIESGAIKAWKQHHKMVLNFIVPYGAIRFVLFDPRSKSPTRNTFQEICISKENYCRLTVPALIWFGFQGVDAHDSILLNIANIPHDPTEVSRKEIREINFNWDNSK